MFRNTLLAIGLMAACCASSNAANKIVKAKGSVDLTAPGGMMEGRDDSPPLDAVALSITSDGTIIRVTATLKDAPGDYATAPVTLSIDSDNNPATGKKGFGKDDPGGFEYVFEMALCIRYDDDSTSCAGGSTKSKAVKRYGAADLKSDYVDWVWNQVAVNGAVWSRR